MARCQHCGRVNRDGSIFCQDCGQRLPPPGGTGPAQSIPQGGPPPASPSLQGPTVSPMAGMGPPPGLAPPAAAPLPDEGFPATRVRQPTPVAGVPLGPTCPACRAVNPPGMNFCKMCGSPMNPRPQTPVPGGLPPPPGVVGAPPGRAPSQGGGLAPVAVAAPAAVPQSGMRPCPSCTQSTPAGFAFCQHCGFRLTPPPGSVQTPVGPVPAPSVSRAVPQTAPATVNEAVAPTIAQTGAGSGSTPVPGAMRPAGNDAYLPTLAPSGAALASLGTLQSASGAHPPQGLPGPRAPTPVGGVPVTPHTGPGSGSAPPAALPPQPSAPAALPPGAVDTFRSPPPAHMRSAPQAQWGRLVCVNRDGSDGMVFPLASDHVAIGRVDGEVVFAEDRYLAPRHAQLERRAGHTFLRVLDDINGAYLRLVEPTPLSDGDQFLFGKQLMRFEAVSPAERDAPAALQHGVMLFGTPPRPAWGRLRQLLTTGQTRDVVHLVRPDITLGREDGDLRFPDDEFMSRRHATLSHRDGRVHLADLGSSNGTYLRLRHERELKSGDLVRLGDQLLRVELG